MAGDPFARASARLFRRLGEEAFFRGEFEPRLFVIERGVQQIGEFGQVTDHRVVAAIPAELVPVEGEVVLLRDGQFEIDRLLDNDGHIVRCLLVSA